MACKPLWWLGNCREPDDSKFDLVEQRAGLSKPSQTSQKTPRQCISLVLVDSLEEKVDLLGRRVKKDAVSLDLIDAMRQQLDELRVALESQRRSAGKVMAVPFDATAEELPPLVPASKSSIPFLSIEGKASTPSVPSFPSEVSMEEKFRPLVKAGTFPMMVMKMEDFLSLEKMEPFSALKRTGRLFEAPEGAVVHFVSHQWLGNFHPDPKCLQLKQLQRYFRMMQLPTGHNDIFTAADWAAFERGSAKETHATAKQALKMVHRAEIRRPSQGEVPFKTLYAVDIQEGYVWLDFASVPQLHEDMTEEDRLDTLDEQKRAIEAIPEYVGSCTYFYVCTPSAAHEDGQLCDFASWRNRGWCRLEEWANFLLPTKTMMPIVITDQPRVCFLEFFDFFLFQASRAERSVFHGQFKCCDCKHELTLQDGTEVCIPCDKETLAPVVERMYDAKLKALVESGNDFLYRIYKVMEPAILAGSSSDRLAQACSPDESIQSFCQRMKLPDDPRQGDKSGAPAIEWAGFMGHSAMVQKLLDARCSADISDNGGLTPLLGAVLCGHDDDIVRVLIDEGGMSPESLNKTSKGLGVTAMDRAAKGGKSDVVSFLISRGASVNVTRKNGATPLMAASEAGHEDVIRLLLLNKADVNAVDSDGQSALHKVAVKWSPDRVERFEREVAVVALLQAGADPMLEDAMGRTAIQIATEQSNIEFVHGIYQYQSPDAIMPRAMKHSYRGSIVESVTLRTMSGTPSTMSSGTLSFRSRATSVSLLTDGHGVNGWASLGGWIPSRLKDRARSKSPFKMTTKFL